MNEEALRLEDLHSKVDFNVLDENLKYRLKNFVVKDAQRTLVGEVKDLYRAPNEQLNLVVLAQESQQDCRRFLLNSKLVHKVDPIAQSLFVILSARRNVRKFINRVSLAARAVNRSFSLERRQSHPRNRRVVETLALIRMVGISRLYNENSAGLGQVKPGFFPPKAHT